MHPPTLESNRSAVLERIRSACATAGREDPVELVAVTKSVAPAVAEELFDLGCNALGENRVPELERKQAWFRARGKEPTWHFIGHIQRNKARRVVALADVLHSIDSLRLLESIARHAEALGRSPQLYLQADLTGDATKTGLAADALPAVLSRAHELGLSVRGLMAMAPFAARQDPEGHARDVFRRLRALARSLPAEAFQDQRPRLSMGMSNDFEIAIAEGADCVRVGSSLFAGLELTSRTGSDAGSQQEGELA